MWEIDPAAVRWRDEKVRPVIDANTQKLIGRPANEYEVHVLAMNHLPFGHKWLHQFELALWRIMWPKTFVLESQGVLNDWAVRMAKGMCENLCLDLVGCASATKTFLASCHCYTMWKVKPKETSVYLSTTSAEAGEARMWGVIKDLFAEDHFKIGKRIDSLQLICLDEEVKDDDGVKNRDFRDVIKFVKIKTGKEGQNAVGAICGRKNKRVIWCADELNFMDLGVLNARVNLFSNRFAQFIGIGNAPSEGSPLYIDSEPQGSEFPDGFRSVNIDLHDEWKTRTGKCLYFNGSKSPNFGPLADPKNPPFPFMMNPQEREKIRVISGGEDTNVFWVQFHGFPPGVEVSDKVLTRKLLEENGAMDPAEWLGVSAPVCVAGLDCGFREGGDPSVIDFCQVGKSVNGDVIGDWGNKDGEVLLPFQNSPDSFEVQMAKRALDKMELRGCHDVAIDVTGEGGMTGDALRMEAIRRGWKLNMVSISFMGSADDKIVTPGERRMASEIFANKVSQIWMMMRVAAQKKLLRGINPHCKATDHLCSRRFVTDERKRFAVERKKDMKKRLGRSPDHGDARALALLMAISKGLSVGVSQTPRHNLTAPKSAQPAPVEKARYGGHATVQRYSGR